VFLAGILTAAIPVIIHLLHRRQAQPVPFSTLMFLRLSHQHVARRRRLREMLLLFLRCTFLILLACAFAGPVLRTPYAGGASSVHAVLVVDASFSMGYGAGGETSFARAQQAAEGIVQSLPNGSECALLFCGARPDLDVPELTPNLLQVKRTLAGAEPGASSVPLAPTLARAARLLADSPWPNKELYVLTDMQGFAWRGSEYGNALRFDGVEAVVIDCGSPTLDNSAVTELVISRHAAAATDEVGIAATVRNFGPRARDISVTLETGITQRVRRASQTVSTPANGAAQVTLREPVADAPIVAGAVTTAPDALPIDNTRYVAAAVDQGVSVLLVGEGGAWDPSGPPPKDILYLKTALGVGGSIFRSFVVGTGDLPHLKLDEYAVVVAGQMPVLDGEAAAVLHRYVEGGGGLVMFLGPRARIEEYNALLGQRGADGNSVLPAPLGERVQTLEKERVSWDEIDDKHPVFEVFAGGLAKELRFIRTGTYIALAESPQAAEEGRMRVLARYADGAPAVVEGRCGEGTVVLFTTSCDGAWSTLPLRASFLPILHRTVTWLAQDEAVPLDARRVGEPLEWLFPGSDEAVSVAITTPDGVVHTVASTLDQGRNRAVFTETNLPGLYRIDARVTPHNAQPIVAINVDPAESDLTRLPEGRLRNLLPGANSLSSIGAAHAGAEMLRRHEGLKLWGPLLAVLVAMALVESLLASLFTPKRGPEGVRTRSHDIATRRLEAGEEAPE